MSGSGLVQFLINVVAILAAGGIFFASIDKVAPDAFFSKIAKIAIGAMLLIALIVTVAAIFGLAGGIAISALGIVYFAIAVIIAVVVLYLINLVVDWIAGQMASGQQPANVGWAVPVKYVLGAIVLIGLLIAAADLLFGYRVASFIHAAAPSVAVAAAQEH